MQWTQFKDYLSQVTSLDQDALHIYAAVLIQLAAAAAFRRSLASVWPWLTVWLVILVNEAVDLLVSDEAISRWHVAGTVQDSWNTMALPTLLWLLAYHAPALLVGSPRVPVSDRSPTQP